MDLQEKLEKFLREYYYPEILKSLKEDRSVVIDFSHLDRFDAILVDELLEQPERVLSAFSLAATSVANVDEKVNVRIRNLPESRKIRIRNLRAVHLNRLWSIDATIKAASEVKPQIYEATFECPDCKARITVPQSTKIIQKPAMCECGRRGDFNLVDKKMIDIRWLKAVEPFEITSGEQPGEITLLLKEDLNTPRMQKKTDPGSSLTIVGMVKEIPKHIKGKLSTNMDMLFEANHVETSQVEFEELEITPQDEKRIKELAADPGVYDMLRASIAPGIYGFDEIKDSVVMQLFGGVPHTLPDGTRIRGNLHILITGDPGVGKSINGDSKILYMAKDRYGYCKARDLVKIVESSWHSSEKQPIKLPLYSPSGQIQIISLEKEALVGISDSGTVIFGNNEEIRVPALNQLSHKIEWVPVTAFVRHSSPKKLIRIKTASRRNIVGTMDHSFLTLGKDGEILSVKGCELNTSMYMPVALDTHNEILRDISIEKYVRKNTNALKIKDKITLGWDFGFFIGAFLAEGCITKTRNSWRISVSTNSKRTQEIIRKFADDIGARAIIKDKSKKYVKSEYVDIYSRDLVRFLDDVCYSGNKEGKAKGAIRKKIPEFTFFSPKVLIYGLLAGLFSGDGYIIKRKLYENRTKDSVGIGLATISKELAYDTLELLASTGIFASLRSKNYYYKKQKHVCYILYICGSYANKFLNNITLPEKIIPAYRFSEKDSLDSIPCGSLLYDIVKELGFSKRSQKNADSKRTFAAMMRTIRSRNRIGRRRLEKIYKILSEEALLQDNKRAVFALEKIARILKSSVIWDKIVELKEVEGEDFVYDISIDGYETFVANNIVVHNTVLLKLISSVVPRGRYVSGSGVTGAGLTASVVKNEAIGGWVLEAGALILCNKGLISIDEFDKMSRDDQIAMHEAMSVESVSIAKASIVATLPAQTAVLAGANPKLGRFDPYMPIGEQIQIPETLLSRFDLKFALRDRPDRILDEHLASHIITSRTRPEMIEPPIPMSLFRKYIAYAKQIISMELSEDAANMLKNFYIDMRNRYAGAEKAVSITLRQYEALIRLAEASARVRLDTTVRQQDAERAIRLMMASLTQLGYDIETQTFDIDRLEGGVAASKRSKMLRVLKILEDLQKETKEVAIDDLKAEAENQGVEDIDEIIERLDKEGMIIYPRPGFVRKI